MTDDRVATGRRSPAFFLVGCPRSGTSLLTRVLDSHPLVGARGAGGGFVRRFLQREGLTEAGDITPGLVGRGSRLKFMDRDGFSAVVREMLGSCGPVPYADLVAEVLDRDAHDRGKRFVGVKVASTNVKITPGRRYIAVLRALWPQAAIVHLIRDGRDVCLSVRSWSKAAGLGERFSGWAQDPVMTAGLWWEYHVRLGRTDGAPAGDRYHEIRYEELTRRPERTCQQLCGVLGVPYDERMLRFHEGRERDGRDAKSAWRPITPGLRDWRTQMNAGELERFEAVAGELLDELGYPRAVPRPGAAARAAAARLRDTFEPGPVPGPA
jgi:hypothetical protein